MDRKYFIASLLIFAVIAVVVYFGWQRPLPSVEANKVQVAASFYPLAEFARGAGGENVEVSTVVPVNTEPHEYEPTPQELARVYNAAVFIYNGSGVDPWAERIAPELERSGVQVINMSETVGSLLPAPKAGEQQENPFDPHYWLDPVQAAAQVGVIRDVLAAVDSRHTVAYQAQSDAYQAQLQQLDQEYRADLTNCKLRDVITSHNAFGYLARRYDLSVTPITGLSPEEEPSARVLGEIAKLAQEKEVRYIFFETLASPKLAETIATEIGAETLVFNPIEGITEADRQAGKNYVLLMRDNLQNLRTALQCQ